MKIKVQIVGLFLLLALLLCACGQNEDKTWNVEELYRKMTDTANLPEMILVPSDKSVYLYGIAEEDCVQELIAISSDSMLADEIWLLEATDENTADKLESLARQRAEQKAAELKNYAPEQYQVVQDAKMIRQGKMIALIITPEAAELTKLIE